MVRERRHPAASPFVTTLLIKLLWFVEHVLEALLNTSVDLDSLEPDSVMEERWIKEVVTRSGMKFRWAKLSENREKPNRDIQRR